MGEIIQVFDVMRKNGKAERVTMVVKNLILEATPEKYRVVFAKQNGRKMKVLKKIFYDDRGFSENADIPNILFKRMAHTAGAILFENEKREGGGNNEK